MQILLVCPEAPDSFWSLKNALRFTSKKALLPPLGLLTVAAILPDDWEARLLDMSIEPLRDRDILWADYVFVTGMYVQRRRVDAIIERCHRLGTKTVAGGPIFTSIPEDYDHVDHLILGEAEVSLPPFIADLRAGRARHIYRSEDWADVGTSPAPRWDLINMRKYLLMGIQFSRGCPFACDFCNVTALFGRRMRTKTTEQWIAELDALYAQGWRGDVFVVDDNFIGNKTLLKDRVLPAMIDWMRRHKRPFKFNTQVSINLADDDELMRLMAEAGFDCVFVGIETANEAGLAECNKTQNIDRDMVDCVRRIQRAGMQVQAGFILGFDSDHASVFDGLIRFIQESGIVSAMVGLLNAPKGTQLYQRLVNENRLLEDGSGDNTDFSMNFVPTMDRDELLNGYRKVVQTIYAPRAYYQRISTFMNNYVPAAPHGGRFRWSDLRTIARSMWHIGIRNRGRRYYWRLLGRSLLHPEQLRLNLTFAIYGFHFRRVFKV